MKTRILSGFRFQGLLIGLLALLTLVITPVAQAGYNGFGFGPQNYKSDYVYGNGVYFAPYEFTLYTRPDFKAEAIGDFRWSRNTNQNILEVTTPDGENHSVYADHVFFCFFPQLDVAMMAVTGDTEQGWVEVIYDQKHQKTGWIKLANSSSENSVIQNLAPIEPKPIHFGIYQTWLEFMKLNAKSSGIYWLSGVSEYQRSIRSSDKDEAKLLPVTIIRDLKVRHIRGNWLLVEVLDFERHTPIGWVRWRDDNGNLMVFPNLSKEHKPVVTTAY